MDNKQDSTNIRENTENSDNSGIASNDNDNNEVILHEDIEEEITSSPQPQEEPSLSIISGPQNTTQQVSELPIPPSNLNVTAASNIASDVVPMSTIGSNVAAHQKSKSRHRLSNSEAFNNLDDNVPLRDTMTSTNRARGPRRSAPTPYRPTKEFDVRKPRPNSQIILPASMKKYNSIIAPNSDQEFHTLARILNWPTQNHELHQPRNIVGLSTVDNLVDDGEIIFDTTSFNQAGDIQQPSHGQIPSYIPQGRFPATAAMHQVTNLSRAPEVSSFISTNYGTEIFDQIQSDDDPKLIVWSMSRAEERKQGSIISSFTNVSSKRRSIYEKLERTSKNICGSVVRDKKDNRFESKISKSKNSNLIPEKVIMAATIEKLVEKLTSGIDYNFLTDFFLTYRAFITPLQLCNLLILRFNWALEADNEQRKMVRVRTFVALRHWLLNYFVYDFVPCRELRITLINYLNTLSVNPLVRDSPRDSRIVKGLKRIIRRLKRIYYRKGILKNESGGINGVQKKDEIIPGNIQRKSSDQFLNFDAEFGGVGVGTSSKKVAKHESSSTLGSVLTPGTTDSESEEVGSLKQHRPPRSRPMGVRQSFEVASINSQYSEDEIPIKRTRSLPTLISETVNDWGQDVNDKSDIENEDNRKFSQKGETIITKKKSKLKSSSMGDLSQRRKLQAEFNPIIEHSSKDDDIIVEEPPPLPPRRSGRRHTFTYTRPTSVASPTSPLPPKGGFLNFPTRKPKKAASEEVMNEKFQDRTRKKRSLSLSEAICGFAEDDDEDEDDEFDLSRIDHAGGIVRRNSSPAYIGSTSEKVETQRRRTGRPSWPQKMSATVGKFAKAFGTGGGIRMLCANSEVSTVDDSENSVPANTIHVDGFSYVDESLEDEYYDTMRQEDFAGTEEQFEWDETSDEEVDGELQDEEEVEKEEEISLDDDGLASSSTEPKTTSTKEHEDDDKNGEDIEQQQISQNVKSNRRKAKVWGDLGPVKEVEEGEPNIIDRPSELSEDEGEIDLDIEGEGGGEENDENNPRRLRRLPKVRDFRTVVTLNKDHVEEKEKSESVRSSSEIETGTQGGKSTTKGLVKKKDKSIIKPSSSESVSNSSITPKKSSESSIKRTVITKRPNKKLPDIPVQNTTTTTTNISAEPGSSKTPIKNIRPTILKSSLNKPLPPLPVQDDRSKKPPSISSTINSQAQYKSFILNYKPEAIAKQFCLIERDFLSKVNWEDLVQVGYNVNKDAEKENVQQPENEEKKKDVKGKGKEKELEEGKIKEKLKKRVRENGVDKVIERFNLACDWVATEVVLTRSLESRVEVIERFIRIAQKCLQYSNFATLTQILLGLQSPPVERLRRTWTLVREEDLRIFKDLSEYISHFGNWKVIREAMRKSIEESTILRELIKQRKSRVSDVRKVNTGCIPFLGLYLSDLIFNAAVPSFIDPTPSQPSTPSSPLPSGSADANIYTVPLHQPLVNFHKHRTTATIVKRVLTFQNLSKEYNFPIDKEIYDKCFGLKGLEATKLVVMDLDVDDFV